MIAYFKEEIIKFIIGIIFLAVVHYQMVLQQEEKLKSIVVNTEKLQESINFLESHKTTNLGININSKDSSIDGIRTIKVNELNFFIDDLLHSYFKNQQSLNNFTYFIKSKKLGLIEITFQSSFFISLNFIKEIVGYKYLIRFNQVKIIKNQTKLELEVIYEK